MNLNFHYVKYKNILSTGNAWTQIDLDKSRSTLILGDNGSGKSTMLDAICFALYGKPFRKINKPQLVNSINGKGLEVEVSFTTNGVNYRIRRGIKPNVFEIWKNDELLNQDAKAGDYQEFLEESILKMNMKSFGQIVVLGSSTFVPFMQLTAANRRQVIEDLLDIQVFSTMNTLLKQKIATNKEQVEDNRRDIEIVKGKIESANEANERIRQMQETTKNDIEERIAEENKKIEQHTNLASTLIEEMKPFEAEVSHKDMVLAKERKYLGIKQELESHLAKIKEDSTFYSDHDHCPTCSQEIDEDFKDEKIKTCVKKQKELEEGLLKLDGKIEEIQERKSQVKKAEDDLLDQKMTISNYRAVIENSMQNIKALQKEIEKVEAETEQADEQKVKGLKERLAILEDEKRSLIEQREVFGVSALVLKDGGIKAQIVKQYVPIMNKLINKYLSQMEFFVDFQLDENFDETIKSRFRDEFSYSSFSEGEKLRIDLALMFTWRAISKIRNSVSTNLLIMDEIMDSSLDNAGTSEFLKIVQELTEDSNVLIISHKGDQLQDNFDRALRFNKVKNFSIMEEIA